MMHRRYQEFLRAVALIACASVIAAGISARAHAFNLSHQGDGTRGGGNLNVAAFYHVGDDILSALASSSPLSFEGRTVDVATLQTVFAQTQITETAVALDLDGASVDAINYPDLNRIEFSKAQWESYSAQQQSQLVIHEILGVNRIPDPAYQLSRDLFTFALSSSSLDIAYLSSENRCDEIRTLIGERAKVLLKAFQYAGMKGKLSGHIKTFKIAEVACITTRGSNLEDGIDESRCQKGPKDAAASLLFIQALSSIGIAAEGAMGHVYYDAKDIVCTIDQDEFDPLKQFSCQVNAAWALGCDGKAE